MNLFGMGASHPSLTCTDDYRLDPPRGLAIVTSGLGAYDLQARPAAVLALWSVVGEVAAGDDDALARGALRAHEALERITLGWQKRIRPTAMLAAVRLAGSRAQIAHAGRCRVSRVGAGGLLALTEDHDLAHAAAAVDPTGAFEAPLPLDLARVTTRALGITDNVDVREIDVEPGDELLLATPRVHELLTPAMEAELCRRDRPIVARALTLTDHGCAQEGPFAFVLVRVVPSGPCLGAAGRSRPPSKCFHFAPGEPLPPPVEGLDNGPDKRWYDEIANGLTYAGSPPLDAELRALADIHPAEQSIPALIRAVRWCLKSLAARFREVPAPLQTLIQAVDQTATLADWDGEERAIEEAFYEWAEGPLGDWASRQALDRVKDALDCLVEWARSPERPQQELGSVLQDLVYAEGMWDWDELAAEAALSGFAPIPDEHFRMEAHRDEKRLGARRALIQVLAEAAPEPWTSTAPPPAPGE